MKAFQRRDVKDAWIVVSGPATYHCYVGTDPSYPRCDCPASIYTDANPCKHVHFILTHNHGQEAQ